MHFSVTRPQPIVIALTTLWGVPMSLMSTLPYSDFVGTATYVGSAKYLIFLENALKKTTEYLVRLIMENNFIQMVASDGHE